MAPIEKDESDLKLLSLLCLVVFLPIGYFTCFKRLRQRCPCGASGDKGREEGRAEAGVSGQLSSATEFTELPSSRKTSNASSSFFSFSPGYEDSRLLHTKDTEGKDRWEFPRHHLKFYGILGEFLWCIVYSIAALIIHHHHCHYHY